MGVDKFGPLFIFSEISTKVLCTFTKKMDYNVIVNQIQKEIEMESNAKMNEAVQAGWALKWTIERIDRMRKNVIEMLDDAIEAIERTNTSERPVNEKLYSLVRELETINQNVLCTRIFIPLQEYTERENAFDKALDALSDEERKEVLKKVKVMLA